MIGFLLPINHFLALKPTPTPRPIPPPTNPTELHLMIALVVIIFLLILAGLWFNRWRISVRKTD